MGQPKMVLPWGNKTVIEQVVTTFLNAGIEDLLIVTGGAHEAVQQALQPYSVQQIYNPDYANGEMLSSLQLGLSVLSQQTQAVLVGLGDQPQVQEQCIRSICETYAAEKPALIVPSFNRKRGHPWLVTRSLWNEILALQPPQTLRDFLNNNSEEIHYLNLDTPTILKDLDTPDDYNKSLP